YRGRLAQLYGKRVSTLPGHFHGARVQPSHGHRPAWDDRANDIRRGFGGNHRDPRNARRSTSVHDLSPACRGRHMAYRRDVKVSRLLLPLLALAALCAVAPSEGKEMYSVKGFEGRVTDRDTGKPIEGAIVVVQWGGSARSAATGMFMCLHVEHAR